MSGAGLVSIKRRIKSITNTIKITRAMGLVATSKLRKTRQILVQNDKYTESFNSLMEQIINNIEEPTLYHGNGVNRRLYIVLTSDTGLCGGFNSSIVTVTANRLMKDEGSMLMVVGQKGRAYFKRLRYETVAEYVELPSIPEMRDASTIAQHGLELFRKGEIGEIYVIYHRFHSAVKQVIEVNKLLPLSKEASMTKGENALIEPDAASVLEGIIDSYLKQKLFNFMIHSKASEQSSRMTAMDGATKNANELLQKLQLKFNRVRQSSITQEISEIVGGATAQK